MDHMLAEDGGGRLRRAREHRGKSLRDVTQRTKLSSAVVQAIERNDFQQPSRWHVPEGMCAPAVEGGLDPDQITADYCARFESSIEPAVPPRQADRQQRPIAQLAPDATTILRHSGTPGSASRASLMLPPGAARPTAMLDDASSPFVGASARGGSGRRSRIVAAARRG